MGSQQFSSTLKSIDPYEISVFVKTFNRNFSGVIRIMDYSTLIISNT